MKNEDKNNTENTIADNIYFDSPIKSGEEIVATYDGTDTMICNEESENEFKSPITTDEIPSEASGVENQIEEINIDELRPYPNHPFKSYTSEKLTELSESIKENGLLNPIIVMKTQDEQGYTILSGHNRVAAHKEKGWKTIKAIVKTNITQAEADLIVVESNLRQREKLLPSEKAKAYHMQLEAHKKQGKRTDLYSENIDEINVSETSSQVGTKLNTADNIAKMNDDSRSNIYRYIKLNKLNQQLLELVDDETIAFGIGVELAELNESGQEIVHNYFFEQRKRKLSLKVAKKIVKIKDGIDFAALDNLFSVKNKKENKQIIIKIPMNKINDVLADVSEEHRIDYIMEAIQFYNKNRNN